MTATKDCYVLIGVYYTWVADHPEQLPYGNGSVLHCPEAPAFVPLAELKAWLESDEGSEKADHVFGPHYSAVCVPVFGGDTYGWNCNGEWGVYLPPDQDPGMSGPT